MFKIKILVISVVSIVTFMCVYKTNVCYAEVLCELSDEQSVYDFCDVNMDEYKDIDKTVKD